jgi:hypothetical protein
VVTVDAWAAADMNVLDIMIPWQRTNEDARYLHRHFSESRAASCLILLICP